MALYVATASVVKVRVGDEGGNGIARIVRRGGVIPADVTVKQIKHLLSIGFIDEIKAEGATAVGPVAAFDPSKHNAEEVLVELESVADDADEVARIRQAERDGKNRQTLTKLWDKADVEPVTTEQN